MCHSAIPNNWPLLFRRPDSLWKRLPKHAAILLSARLEEDGLLRKTVFQQDGAPCHYASAVREFLDHHFPSKWVGRMGPILWPQVTWPYSFGLFLVGICQGKGIRRQTHFSQRPKDEDTSGNLHHHPWCVGESDSKFSKTSRNVHCCSWRTFWMNTVRMNMNKISQVLAIMWVLWQVCRWIMRNVMNISKGYICFRTRTNGQPQYNVTWYSAI